MNQEQNFQRNKVGRWSRAEQDIFQTVIEKYGNNWDKVHEKLKHRSKGQIRSHAQKYFAKICPNKVKQYRKRAQLLQTYKNFHDSKQLKQVIRRKLKFQNQIGKNQQSLPTESNSNIENQIKNEKIQQVVKIQEKNQIQPISSNSISYQPNQSFFMNMFHQNLAMGIPLSNFINCPDLYYPNFSH